MATAKILKLVKNLFSNIVCGYDVKIDNSVVWKMGYDVNNASSVISEMGYDVKMFVSDGQEDGL